MGKKDKQILQFQMVIIFWVVVFCCYFQCLILVIEQQYVHSRENSAEKGYLISCFNKFDQ